VALRERDANRLASFRDRPSTRPHQHCQWRYRGGAGAALLARNQRIRVYDVRLWSFRTSRCRDLLGMSFLSRVRRFEMANGRLVMEQ